MSDSLDEIWGAPKAAASLDDIWGTTAAPAPKTPAAEAARKYVAAPHNSPEKQAALDEMYAATKAADREKSYAEAGTDLPILGRTTIPQAMGMAAPAIAAVASGGLSIPESAATATVGGTAGTVVDEAMRRMAGAPSTEDVAGKATQEGATQGALQLVGEGAGKLLSGPIANEATRAIAAEGKRLGIPATPDRVIAAGNNPAVKYPLALIRGVSEDILTLGGRLGTRAQEGVSRSTRDAIKAATTDKLNAGLPPALGKEDLITSGDIMKRGVTAMGDAGEAVKSAAYQAAETAAAADPKAAAKPDELLRAYEKWREIKDQGGHLTPHDETILNKIKAKIFTTEEVMPPYRPGGGLTGPPVTTTKLNPLHYSDMAQLRTELGQNAYRTAEGLPATPNEAMLRALRHGLDADVDRIPNPLVVQLDRQAKDVYKALVAPFKKGEGRDLVNLAGESPENFYYRLTSSKGTQLLREISEVNARHPSGPAQATLAQAAAEINHNIIQDSVPLKEVPLYGHAVDGSMLRRNINKYAASLQVLHGPGYVEMARDLASGIEHAQQTPKGAFGRHILAGSIGIHSLYSGGAALAHGAGLVALAKAIPVALGVVGTAKALETSLGMRWLAQGFFPRTFRAAAGVLTHAGYDRLMNPPLSDEQQQKVEASLPPVAQAQIAATKQGPQGEVPIARISKEQHPYDALIASSAAANGISPQLVKATLMQESSMNPKATSPKGAMGIAQIMPALAKDLGVRNPYDATEAIPAATQHLANLMQRYGGDKEKALAAYNAGPRRVDESGGVPAIEETQKYVQGVLKREKEYSSERQAIMDKTENLTWPEIAKRFRQAKNKSDQSEWSSLRRAVNARIKNNLNKPTLGMAQADYQRYLPIIVEALKPEAT